MPIVLRGMVKHSAQALSQIVFAFGSATHVVSRTLAVPGDFLKHLRSSGHADAVALGPGWEVVQAIIDGVCGILL